MHEIFTSDFATQVPGVETGSSTACEQAYATGLRITSKAQYNECVAYFDQVPEIASVRDVSVDATVEYTAFSGTGPYGPGDASIVCRLTGDLATGSFYVASLSPSGYVLVDKFVDGKEQHKFQAATDKSLSSNVGQQRRLTFTCLDSGGSTELSFSVDGKEVASHTDPSGLSAGAIALGADDYLSGPFSVTYRTLSVLGVASAG